jgi:ketosteroid isomerase-like protein
MTQSELETRINALEDIKSIKSLTKEFVFLLRESKLEETINYFSDNAVVEMRLSGAVRGKAEIARLLKKEASALNNPTNVYMLIQPVLTANGDTARAHWIMDYFTQDPENLSQPSPTYIPGRYDCEYIKDNGKWKFSSLKWTSPWPVRPVKQ